MISSRRTLLAWAATAAVPNAARSQEPAGRFPFRVTRNAPWAPVIINDKDPPAPFLIDTGAAVYSILAETAERYGLSKANDGRIQTLQGKPVVNYRAPSLLVGGSIRDRDVALSGRLVPFVEDLQGSIPFAAFGVAGLDFDSQMAGMWRKSFDGTQVGYHDAELTTDSNFCVVRAELDGNPVRLRVNTGRSDFMALTSSYVSKHGLWERYPHSRFFADEPDPSYRFARGQRLKIANVAFAGPAMTIYNPKAGLSDLPASDGWIGMELLRRLNFVIDRPAGKLWVKPSQAITDGYRHNRSGLAIDRVGSSIQVASLLPNGPARRAGVRPDDRITGWRGRDGYYGLAWALYGPPGSTVEIQVERDGKPQIIAITLEEPF